MILSDARRRQIGVQTEAVAMRSFARDLRLTGIVRIDERLQRHVHVKFEGFVERVFVNFVGRPVRRGEPLLSVYSPELLAAETELAQALADRDRPRSGQFAESDRAQAVALVEAARARLALFDVPAAEVRRLERTRQPSRTLVISSPISGTVIERSALDGMRVMPDSTLFVVADLARVWVVGSVFESDLGSVQVGDGAHVTFAGGAAPDRDAAVSFIAPTLNEATRTANLRIELDNRDGLVRPGLFAEITLSIDGGPRLAVPVAAVIDTGRRSIAFVETSPGRFEPRDVRVGGRAGDWLEVREGVQAGERVATRAQFLLDAESQIRGGPAGPAHGGH